MAVMKTISQLAVASLFGATIVGCDSSSTSETPIEEATQFQLNFAAMAGGEDVTCDTQLGGFGMHGHHMIGVSDLRFYVSNIKFYNQDNQQIELTLDDNQFQLNHEAGFVGLVDLTSNVSGTCNVEGEGTERTNSVITGSVMDANVSSISFDIGVPQAVMKQVISTTSAEDAPSPLNEMYWSWASGYRHLVLNFKIEDMQAMQGDGFVHIGSRGCGDDGLFALENKDECDFVNSPTVMIENFDLFNDAVVLDLSQILDGLMFTTHDMDGHGDHSGDSDEHSAGDAAMAMPAVSCHSAPITMQPDCGPIFSNLGLTAEDGTASAASNSVFGKL